MTTEPAARPPVFLVGMERCGTSLLRAILHRHSRIAIPARGELQFFANWHGRGGPLSDRGCLARFAAEFFENSKFRHLGVERDAVLERFARSPRKSHADFFAAVMEAYAAKEGKPRWGEKSTSHIDRLDVLLESFPDATIALIVRDPRDAFLSTRGAKWMRDRPVTPASWGKRWRTAYGRALAKIESLGPRRAILYRHESLVADPEREWRRVCDFLGEPFEPECLRLDAVDWKMNSSHGDGGEGISPKSVGRWREALPPPELAALERACSPLMERFGYERATRPTLRERLSRLAAAMRGEASG